MREILFRGKQIDTGEWVYGYYVPACFGRFPCRPAIVPEPNGEWKPIEVKPETIGEYTDLTDKNGKRIFEGDIVEYHCEIRKDEFKDIIYVVNEEPGYWAIDSADYYGFVLGLRKLNTKVKIIGNIHDNPELLGVE